MMLNEISKKIIGFFKRSKVEERAHEIKYTPFLHENEDFRKIVKNLIVPSGFTECRTNKKLSKCSHSIWFKYERADYLFLIFSANSIKDNHVNIVLFNMVDEGDQIWKEDEIKLERNAMASSIIMLLSRLRMKNLDLGREVIGRVNIQ